MECTQWYEAVPSEFMTMGCSNGIELFMAIYAVDGILNNALYLVGFYFGEHERYRLNVSHHYGCILRGMNGIHGII